MTKVSKAFKVDAIVQALIEKDPQFKRSDKTLHMLDQANTFKGAAHFPINQVKQDVGQVNGWEDLYEPSKVVKKN